MDQKIQNILGLTLTFVLLVALGVSVWYANFLREGKISERTFQVEGEGRVVAVPDIAEVFFGVTTEGGKNIAVLQRENTEKTNAIISFLREQGIEEKDIQTESYTISPRYQYSRCGQAPLSSSWEEQFSEDENFEGSPSYSASLPPCSSSEIIGYTIQQSLSVKVRDLGKAGDILAGVAKRGANNVSGPTFTIGDPTALQNQAREKAMVQAREKAEALARAGGFKLGKLVLVEEEFDAYPISLYATPSFREEGGSPEIQPGSREITVRVFVKYEIQ